MAGSHRANLHRLEHRHGTRVLCHGAGRCFYPHTHIYLKDATFLEGIGYDKKVVARMKSLLDGIPASTTSIVALRVMEAIGAKKVSFVGPYLDEVISRGRQFFEQSGYEVTGTHGMGYRGYP